MPSKAEYLEGIVASFSVPDSYSDFSTAFDLWYTMATARFSDDFRIYTQLQIETVTYLIGKMRLGSLKIKIGQDEVDRSQAIRYFMGLLSSLKDDLKNGDVTKLKSLNMISAVPFNWDVDL